MTDHAATDNLHHVTVKHEYDVDGDITSTRITFECRGDRTSPCHQYPDCDCDGWSDEHDKEHPPVTHDECWLASWFDAGYEAAPYDLGDGTNYLESDVPAGSGPISFEYDEGILWRWADEVTA